MLQRISHRVGRRSGRVSRCVRARRGDAEPKREREARRQRVRRYSNRDSAVGRARCTEMRLMAGTTSESGPGQNAVAGASRARPNCPAARLLEVSCHQRHRCVGPPALSAIDGSNRIVASRVHRQSVQRVVGNATMPPARSTSTATAMAAASPTPESAWIRRTCASSHRAFHARRHLRCGALWGECVKQQRKHRAHRSPRQYRHARNDGTITSPVRCVQQCFSGTHNYLGDRCRRFRQGGGNHQAGHEDGERDDQQQVEQEHGADARGPRMPLTIGRARDRRVKRSSAARAGPARGVRHDAAGRSVRRVVATPIAIPNSVDARSSSHTRPAVTYTVRRSRRRPRSRDHTARRVARSSPPQT